MSKLLINNLSEYSCKNCGRSLFKPEDRGDCKVCVSAYDRDTHEISKPSEWIPIPIDENKKSDEFKKNNIASIMPYDEFKKLLEELDGNSVATLAEKNARYSSNGDALHNFRSGGDILGGTPAQACWGYATKHLVALRDMVEKNDFSNREDFLEKCQDTINYIRFLWCIGNEIEINKKKEKENK